MTFGSAVCSFHFIVLPPSTVHNWRQLDICNLNGSIFAGMGVRYMYIHPVQFHKEDKRSPHVIRIRQSSFYEWIYISSLLLSHYNQIRMHFVFEFRCCARSLWKCANARATLSAGTFALFATLCNFHFVFLFLAFLHSFYFIQNLYFTIDTRMHFNKI